MVLIKLPSVLSKTGRSEEIEVDGKTVLEVFKSYTEKHDSQLQEEVLDGNQIKQYINVYVNGKDIRNIDGVKTKLEQKDKIRIMPAASGGSLNKNMKIVL